MLPPHFSSLESNLAIFIGIGSRENFLNVFLTNEDGQRSHDETEVFLGEELLIQFIFLLGRFKK